MYLSKSSPRGSDVVLYDKTNKVLTVAWNDNKVVNVVSTLSVSGKTTIQRRIGKDLHYFPVEKCIKKYQQGMGGVDKFDQRNKAGGGFLKKAHFKKWYKKIHLGLMDYMLANGQVGR